MCGHVVGCILGPDSYLQGNLPGDLRFLVQLQEPSSVQLDFYLDNILAAGQQTQFTWNEVGCGSNLQQAVDGRTAIDQMRSAGSFFANAQLNTAGDHFIEVHSDIQAAYLFKIDVIPQRTP